MTQRQRVILNTRTGEFFDADDAALIELVDIPLNLDFIRDNGDDIRSFGDTITTSLGDPNIHVVEDMLAEDGHDHVVMFVDKGVRDDLRGLLCEPEMRGIGYTDFIRKSIALWRHHDPTSHPISDECPVVPR